MKNNSFIALSLSVLLLQACGGGSGDSAPNTTSEVPAAVPAAGIVVSQITNNTSESGTTATFTVRLHSQPTASVTIPVNSSDSTEGTVNKTTLTFTKNDWDSNQTVTVTGVNDSLADGNIAYSIILGSASSNDLLYNGLNPPDVSVTNVDVRVASFVISAISGNTSEDGTKATFTVRLGSQPTDNVGIAVTSKDLTEGTVSPANLIFTNTDWNTDQTVTVTGVSDAVINDNITYSISLGTTSSNDSLYNGLNPPDVSVTNVDVNVPVAGFDTTAISGNTRESGTSASFQVRLISQPTATVTIPVSSSDLTEGTVNPSSLIFTTTNWNAYKTVTVTGVGDLLADGNVTYSIILGTASSADTLYNGLDPKDVAVTNVDDTVSLYGVTPAISAGNYHNLVLANDGSVWGWGDCSSRQLDITPPCTSTGVLPQQLNIGKAAAISAGYNFSAIVDNNDSVWTSGVDTFNDGFLGHTPTTGLAKVSTLTDVKMVAAGTYHVLALKKDGTVWAWGNGITGSLGNGSYIISQNPVQSTGLSGVSSIAVGSDHSLALDNSGTVYAWGSDGYEQLGGGVPWPVANDTATPTAISSLSGATLIAAGQYQSFAYAIKPSVHATNMDAWGWGANANNLLGISTLAVADPGSPAPGGYFSAPNALNTFSNTVIPSKIDSGFYHTVALRSNGAVYTWGDNDKDPNSDSWDNRGALGNGTETDSSTGPALAFTAALGSPGPALDVNAGANYTLVLFADGRLQTSGKNTSAQLGTNEIASNDPAIYTTTPVYVEDPGDLGPGSPSNFYAYRPILAGYPAASTTSTTATVWVCPNNLVAPANCGPITHYMYRTSTNGSSWSSWSVATPIANQINLSGLAVGSVYLGVKGIVDNGTTTTELQTDASAVKVSWTIN